TEDQRNWTDGSYKTYCTPLRLPYPVEIRAGERVAQAVEVSLGAHEAPAEQRPQAPASGHRSRRPVLLSPGPETGMRRLPALGLSTSSHGRPLSPREVERLQALHLTALRIDLHFRADWDRAFRQAAEQARELGVRLEVALFLSEAADQELGEL